MSPDGESPSGPMSWWRQIQDPLVRVALVAAVSLLVQAVIAKNVLDVELDVISQFGAMWIFIAYLLTGRRDRRSETAAISAIIIATVAIIVLYAV